jgi:hypothetical protein
LPPPPGKCSSQSVENLNVNIATVKSIVEKVMTDTTNTSCDPVVITGMNSICEAIKLLSNNQAEIVSRLANNSSSQHSSEWVPVTKNSNSYAVIAGAKKSRLEHPPANYFKKPAPPPPPPSHP